MSAVKPAAVATTGITIPYDEELERHKIAFQMQQWEETKVRWENERIEREANQAANVVREQEKERMAFEREKLGHEKEQENERMALEREKVALRIGEEREKERRKMVMQSEYRQQQLDLLRKQVEV